jgi:membrane protease YdiL (CAAX protease family)
MSEEPLLFIYILLLYAGLLLPIPSVILAWREWTKTRKVPPSRAWRRTMSRVGLLLFIVGVAFAVSIAVAEARNKLSQHSYDDSRIKDVGVWGSVATITVSALAENKIRRYLLLGAIGLLCFFCFGLTEAI